MIDTTNYELAAIDLHTNRRRLSLLAIVLLFAFNAYGCATATNKQETPTLDMDAIADQIVVTYKLYIPALKQYCEIDNGGILFDTCVPHTSYAESEDE